MIEHLGKARRHVFLSPHPDDAVWSCGGLLAALAEAGCDVTVLCVFAGDPAPPSLPLAGEIWRRTEPALRRAEELSAVRDIGASAEMLSFVDAALRVDDGAWRYASLDELLGDPKPADGPLLANVTAALGAHLRPDDRVYAPLGVSSHVDHVLVRSAVEKLREPEPFCYYDEFPYSPERLPEALIARVFPAPFEPWLRAALRHRSQVLRMFGARARFQDLLAGWAKSAGREIGQGSGVRLWFSRAAR